MTESRDTSRARGGMIIYGYTSHFAEGFDQTNPAEVSEYLASLLREENTGSYIGPYGQAPLGGEHAIENYT